MARQKTFLYRVMTTKLSLLFFIFTVFNMYSAKYTPENTVFAFDLNGVVLNTDYYKATVTGLKEITNLGFFCNFFAWPKMYKTKKRYGITGKFFDELAKEYPSAQYSKETILKLKNFQKINTDVIDIIKKLKSQGYKIYIFSNIAPEALKHLETAHSTVMNLFDGKQTPNDENDYVRKPRREAFRLFKNTFDPDHEGRTIIFVDNEVENVTVATEEGFIAIHYTSPNQLQAVLNNLGA